MLRLGSARLLDHRRQIRGLLCLPYTLKSKALDPWLRPSTLKRRFSVSTTSDAWIPQPLPCVNGHELGGTLIVTVTRSQPVVPCWPKAGHIRWINTVLGLYVPMLITPLQLMGE